jgi:hypothetical protein
MLRSPLSPTRARRAIVGLAVGLSALVIVAGCATEPDAVIRRPSPAPGSTRGGPGTTVAAVAPPLPTGPDGLPMAKVVANDDGNRSSFDAPVAVRAGPIAIEFTNAGATAHDLTILAPHPGLRVDQLDEVLAGPAPEAASAVSTFFGGAGPIPSKSSQVIAVLLEPGDYELAAVARGADGRVGASQGLHRTLVVTGPTVTPGQGGTPPLPTVIGAVGLRDDGIDLPDSFAPGWYRVSNAGSQVHDLTLARASDGVKTDDVKQWLTSADNGKPPSSPPFAFAGGAAPLDPRSSVWVKLSLAAGSYLAWDDQSDRGGDFHPFREKGVAATFDVT